MAVPGLGVLPENEADISMLSGPSEIPETEEHLEPSSRSPLLCEDDGEEGRKSPSWFGAIGVDLDLAVLWSQYHILNSPSAAWRVQFETRQRKQCRCAPDHQSAPQQACVRPARAFRGLRPRVDYKDRRVCYTCVTRVVNSIRLPSPIVMDSQVGPQRGALSIMQRQNLIDLEPVCFRERIPMH